MSEKEKRSLSEPSEAELASRITIAKIHAISDFLSKIVNKIFMWGTLLTLGLNLIPVLGQFAGKTTNASFFFEAIVNEHLTKLVVAILGLGGIGYGVAQKKLSQATIKRYHPYQVRHEEEHDPQRTSSNLTATGKTRQEDL